MKRETLRMGAASRAAVYMYSSKTNSWRSSPANDRRAGAVAGVFGGRLVVAGEED